MAASETFIEVRKYQWSDGSTTTERSDGCANLICLISFAAFVAGCSCFLGGCACFVLAVLFWFLSLIWLFKTDLQFEMHYASKIDALNTQLNNLHSQQPKFPNDAGYMEKFKSDLAKKEAAIRAEIAELEQKRENERVKRGGKRVVPVAQPLGDEEAPPPEEDPIYQKIIAMEEELQRGIETYIDEAESTSMKSALNTFLDEELKKNPHQIPELMKARDITADEAKAEITRTLYQNYSNELSEVRNNSRGEARIKARMAIMNEFNGTSTDEEKELLVNVRRLNRQ